MKELERHIEILLLTNDCVIVPNLGGFMTHHVDAHYDEIEKTFYPPFRTLGFNPNLTMNDSLLVQSYIETYDISYPEALRRIEAEVEELHQHLENDGYFELNDIGVLSLNEEGRLEFEPCEAGILTPHLYGLSSFEMPPLMSVSKLAPNNNGVIHPEDHAITIKMSWVRNIVAAAAAVIAFFMIGVPVSNSISPVQVQQSSLFPVSYPQKDGLSTSPSIAPNDTSSNDKSYAVDEIAVAAANDDNSAEIQSNNTPTTLEPFFCIVLASQVSKQNAEFFIESLGKQGFSEAYILEKKFRRVVYGRYMSQQQADDALRQLRAGNNQFHDAWVLKVD